jgi:hypothetical protein
MGAGTETERTGIGNDHVELADLFGDALGNLKVVFFGCRVQPDDANDSRGSEDGEGFEILGVRRVPDTGVYDDVGSLGQISYKAQADAATAARDEVDGRHSHWQVVSESVKAKMHDAEKNVASFFSWLDVI